MCSSLFRCFIPECETHDQSKLHFMAPWVRNAVPFRENKPWKCKRFKNAINTKFNKNECTAYFNFHEVENCREWVFATDEVTIVREVCIALLIYHYKKKEDSDSNPKEGVPVIRNQKPRRLYFQNFLGNIV